MSQYKYRLKGQVAVYLSVQAKAIFAVDDLHNAKHFLSPGIIFEFYRFATARAGNEFDGGNLFHRASTCHHQLDEDRLSEELLWLTLGKRST